MGNEFYVAVLSAFAYSLATIIVLALTGFMPNTAYASIIPTSLTCGLLMFITLNALMRKEHVLLTIASLLMILSAVALTTFYSLILLH